MKVLEEIMAGVAFIAFMVCLIWGLPMMVEVAR